MLFSLFVLLCRTKGLFGVVVFLLLLFLLLFSRGVCIFVGLFLTLEEGRPI